MADGLDPDRAEPDQPALYDLRPMSLFSCRGRRCERKTRSRGSGREKVASIHSQVLSEALRRSQQEFFHRVSYHPGHSVPKPADRIVSEVLVEYVQIF